MYVQCCLYVCMYSVPFSAVGDASSAADKNGLVGVVALFCWLSPPTAESAVREAGTAAGAAPGVEGGEFVISVLRGLNGSMSKSGAC